MIHHKLQTLLNKALPNTSKLRLRVLGMVGKDGFNVEIYKNEKCIDIFTIKEQAAYRLITD